MDLRLQFKRSGFKPWPGSLCLVLGQDTSLSLANLVMGENPVTDWRHIKREAFLVALCYRNQNTFLPNGPLLVCMQTCCFVWYASSRPRGPDPPIYETLRQA